MLIFLHFPSWTSSNHPKLFIFRKNSTRLSIIFSLFSFPKSSEKRHGTSVCMYICIASKTHENNHLKHTLNCLRIAKKSVLRESFHLCFENVECITISLSPNIGCLICYVIYQQKEFRFFNNFSSLWGQDSIAENRTKLYSACLPSIFCFQLSEYFKPRSFSIIFLIYLLIS